ncbi:hypothetical protein NC651_031231 [Populus alba x Populus x berolinensis]|nr:hypothetical protein NC651_031231 [Populus alba x Populus x berolinensis]
MKVSGLWILYLMVGTALMFLNCSPGTTCLAITVSRHDKSGDSIHRNPNHARVKLLKSEIFIKQSIYLSINVLEEPMASEHANTMLFLNVIPDVVFTDSSGSMTMATTSRKLKDNGYDLNDDVRTNAHNANLEDYHPIDPVPSSKTSIKPGPIEHGTPLNPLIPKPSPPRPGHPKPLG